MFNNITINKFQGLNTTFAPEMLDVGEARDILNFRHEKIGKLVNRNGVVYGLYTKDENEVWSFKDSNRWHDGEFEYIQNNGFCGIGEFITDGRFDACDTDRFMVYACIGYGEAKDENDLPYPNFEGEARRFLNFLISPITGKYTNLIYNFGVTFFREVDDVDKTYSFVNSRNINPQDLITSPREPLFAPRGVVNGIYTDPNTWVDAFVKMTQYRHSLIVSDRTNGDMMIEDEYNLRTGQECLPNDAAGKEPPQTEAIEHNFRFRPNALDKFDIDIVNFDLRLDADEENDITEGVETAMALYQFEVEKDVFKVTQDYYDPEANKVQYYEAIPYEDKTLEFDELYDLDDANLAAVSVVRNYMDSIDLQWETQVKPLSQVPMHIRQYIGSYIEDQQVLANNYTMLWSGRPITENFPFLKYDWNTELQYIYTNQRFVEEFTNVASPVRLLKTETKNEDGEPIDSYSAGVYLWNDMKFDYQPVQSKTGNFYLSTAEDREFDRAIGGAPRIVEFKDLEGKSREVPLTGWKYRFVWDYGNDILSAPSTDIVAPDMLWRVKVDDDNIAGSTRYNVGKSEWDKTLGKYQADSQLGTLSDLPPFFDETTKEITGVGRKVWEIKREMYDISHEFGSQTEDVDVWTDEQRENFGTLITVKSSNFIKMEGVFCEGLTALTPQVIRTSAAAKVFKIVKNWRGTPFYFNLQKMETNSSRLPIGDYLIDAPTIIVAALPLMVAIHPNVNSLSYNSLFDVKGKMRKGYLNQNTRSITYTDSYLSSTTPPGTLATNTKDFNDSIITKQIVLPGYNGGLDILYYPHQDNTLSFTVGATGSSTPYYGKYTHKMSFYETHTDKENRYTGLFYDRITATPDNRVVNDAEPYWVMTNLLDCQYTSYFGIDLFAPGKFTPKLWANKLLHLGVMLDDDDLVFNIRDVHKSFSTYMISETILNSYSPRSFLGPTLNLIADDTDNNNDNTLTINRISTLLRLARKKSDAFDAISPTVKQEAVKRLVLEGYADFEVLSNNEEFFWGSQYFVNNYENTYSNPTADNNPIDNLARENLRYPTMLANTPTPISVAPTDRDTSQILPVYEGVALNDESLYDHHQDYLTNNIEAHVYLEAQRLLAYEQLTSIFPSSLLFNAPRLGITIPTDKIPRRAKRLRIFRTLSTVQNEYDPLSYGLVESVDILRYTKENAPTPEQEGMAYVVDEDGVYHDGLYYFDKIKDANLDFTVDVDISEGLRRPIHSRFNMPLNERMYYANFKQYYQPEPPRLAEGRADADRFPSPFDPDNFAEEIRNTHYYTFETTDLTRGFADGEIVQYAYAYEDGGGILSQPKFTQIIDPSLKEDGTQLDNDFVKAEVVLFYLPNGYNGSIEHLNIYRKNSTKDDCVTWLATGDNQDNYELWLTANGYTDSEWKQYEYYFTANTALTFYKIGKITEKDSGIFYDWNKVNDADNTPLDLMGCTHAVFNNYESAIIYSEPYRPDFIKQDSFMEIRSGDGEQITGLASLYGNLIILKENSIHRVAVQAENALPSRTDEVSPDVGCISPESLITVDNNVYFLSSQGIMVYDNNQLLSIDDKINEEIRVYLKYLQEQSSGTVGVPLQRFVTAGYNPEYREIYFNFPILQPFDNEIDRKYFDYDREFVGNVYVFQTQTKLWYKFGYGMDLIDIANSTIDDEELDDNIIEIKRRTSQLGNTKIYYTNSLGEMRSANVKPSNYNVGLDRETVITAMAYIETPYDGYLPSRVNNADSPPNYKPYLSNDDVIDNESVQDNWDSTNPGTWDETVVFPPRRAQPIKVRYKSQFVTLDRETVLKRINRIVGNIYSESEITVKTLVNRRDVFDERISNNYDVQTFIFNPTAVTIESNPHPITQIDNSGAITSTNVLTAIPSPAITGDEVEYTIDDSNLKGISFSVEIESEMKTQINEITFYLRPIHLYLQ